MTNTTETRTPSTDSVTATTAAPVTFPQVTWFEIHTADPSAAREFYCGLFGWSFAEMADGYHGIEQGAGQVIGGGISDTRGEWPSCVIPLVQVTDVAAIAAKVTGLGGSVLAEPQTMPNGLTFAYLADRDASAFGVWCPPSGA